MDARHIELKSTLSPVHMFEQEWPDALIEQEPMLFGADLWFAVAEGGPITRAIVEMLAKLPSFRLELETMGRYATVDTRVHMLMPGWYPCIPGWHLDMVPRRVDDGKPDVDRLDEAGVHYLLVAGSAQSHTQFLVSDSRVLHVDGAHFYDELNQFADAGMRAESVRTMMVLPQTLYRFTGSDAHRGMACANTGWRYFIRVSINKTRKPADKIRKQTQVYLTTADKGW